jgi:nucleotide-binding universal stress UspA family protein
MSEQASRPDERVFLVVVDESPEMRNALRYACRRAKRTGGRVAMLYVMDPPEAQQWGAVVDLMRQEARQQAEEVIAKYADVQPSISARAKAVTSSPS